MTLLGHIEQWKLVKGSDQSHSYTQWPGDLKARMTSPLENFKEKYLIFLDGFDPS